MIRLLNKPLKTFSIYALIILLCSIPAYHFFLNAVWIGELDERNERIKNRIQQMIATSEVDASTLSAMQRHWDVLQPGISLSRIGDAQFGEDQTYTTEKQEGADGEEMEQYRGLSCYFRVNGNGYHLVVETNIDEADEIIFIIGTITMAFVLMLIVGFILLNRRISGKIWRPFYESIRRLKEFNLASEQKVVFEESDIMEFAALNHELEQLITKNIGVYRRQRQFVENASHELQTPVALLKSKFDMVLQSKDLTEDQSRLLNEMMIPLARLTRPNKNLLMLARMENHQFAYTTPLDLKELILENIEMFNDYSKSKGLTMEMELSSVVIEANKVVLEALVNNLISNAVKYSEPGSSIRIELTKQSFAVINSGKEPLVEESLFDRFGRSSKESGNVGLGLAIVKEICEQNHWSVRYSFREGKHHFVVHFR